MCVRHWVSPHVLPDIYHEVVRHLTRGNFQRQLLPRAPLCEAKIHRLVAKIVCLHLARQHPQIDSGALCPRMRVLRRQLQRISQLAHLLVPADAFALFHGSLGFMSPPLSLCLLPAPARSYKSWRKSPVRLRKSRAPKADKCVYGKSRAPKEVPCA